MKFILSLAMLAAFAAASAAPLTPPDTVKVMSYNVRGGVCLDGTRNHRASLSVIRAEAPALVALQEVDSLTARSGRTFLASELADSLGMHATYARAIPYDGGAYGIALLSTEKPLAVRRIPLPGSEEPRVLLIAEFSRMVMFCTHLSLTAADRLASARTIAELAEEYAGRPVILAGDLNAEPVSPEIGWLRQTFDIVSLSEPTCPADNPAETIDYIMVKKGSADATGAHIPLAPFQSDHRPTAVTLIF